MRVLMTATAIDIERSSYLPICTPFVWCLSNRSLAGHSLFFPLAPTFTGQFLLKYSDKKSVSWAGFRATKSFAFSRISLSLPLSSLIPVNRALKASKTRLFGLFNLAISLGEVRFHLAECEHNYRGIEQCLTVWTYNILPIYGAILRLILREPLPLILGSHLLRDGQ